MDHKCEFCGKEYSNLYTLKTHQKSAKFCIEMQKTINIENIEENSFDCKYCNKMFNLKSVLDRHLSSCKIRITTINIDDKYKQQIQNYEKEIALLKQSLESKDEQILKLEKQLAEKDQHIIKNNEKLTNEIINRSTTVIHDNSTHNSYNLQYKQMVENLVPYTNENIRERVLRLSPEHLIYDNNNEIDENFACQLAHALKDIVFCTDISRGSLVIKNTDNVVSRIQSEGLIIKVINEFHEECINIFRICLETVRRRVQEFTDEDYGKCITKIAHIADCINGRKSHPILVMTSNKLSKSCNLLSKKTIQ